MRIPSESVGTVSPGYASAAASAKNVQKPDSAVKTTGAESSFDQVNISENLAGPSKLQRELAARLVQDVRAAASTGVIQQLREQVRSGTYRVDPESIASAMLLGE